MRHERKRNKLGKTPGSALQVGDGEQMTGAVLRSFNVAKHDGRGSFKAGLVSGFHNLEPLPRSKLVRAQGIAYFVVQYFRRRARERIQSRSFQLPQKIV